MISQINIAVNAAKPKFPLPPMVAFNGSPSSVRISGIPKTIGEWNISSVKVVVSYPTNVTLEKQATFVDGLWIATVDGSQMNGVVKNGFQIIADGVDEIGNPVTGYVLGVGDVVVLERDKGIEKLVQKYAMRYLNEPPTNPSIGDLLNLNGNVRIWDGSKWISVSGDDVEVYDSAITLQANGVEFDSFTVNASEAKTIDIPVPSTTSELENDSGFITSSAIPSTVSSFENDVGYITASAIPPIPSQTSDLVNDSGFITLSAIPPIPSTTSDLLNDSGFITASAIPSQVSAFENDAGYITQSAIPSNVGAFSNDVGYLTSVSWGDVSGKPDVALASEIPSKVSELDNDAGYITASAIPAVPSKTSELDNDSGFITASDIPAIPSQTSDLVNNSGFITASAIPSNVGAFTNDVGYLTASTMPPIPSQISAFQNDVGYLSAVSWSQVSDKPDVALVSQIPTTTASLVNDSGFITASALSGYATENYVDGKVLALSSIYALDSDLDLVVASVSSMNGSIQTIDTSVQTLELNVSDIQTYTGELGVSISALNASVSSIQTSLSTYATISYVDSLVGSINTVLDNINGEVI